MVLSNVSDAMQQLTNIIYNIVLLKILKNEFGALEMFDN